MDKYIVSMLAVIVLLLALIVGLTALQEKSCEDAGGKMEGTGEYTTIYIKSGNVMIPQTTEKMECVR